jgi:anti-sigma factor RsiW
MLTLYAGGDLAPRDAAKVEAHLVGCESCRAGLEGFRRAREVLKSADCTEESLPAEDTSYWHEVEGKLRGRTLAVERLSAGGPWWLRLPKLAAQAAVVLLVAAALVWISTLDREQAEKPLKSSHLVLERRPSPIVVLVRPSSPYRQAEAFALPIADNEVNYSDFNHVVSPGEIRRLRQQVLPASAEDKELTARF